MNSTITNVPSLSPELAIFEDKSTRKFRFYDSVFRKSLTYSSLLFIALLVGMFITLLIQSLPSIEKFGFSFYTGTTWDAVNIEFGSLPFLVGTIITSFLALVIAVPFSISISLFLGEYFRKGFLSNLLRNCVELLGGIPSVIYGFWGLFFLVPIMRGIEEKMGLPPLGIGILTTSVLLFIMIIPYSASIGREVISMVPDSQKEAALSLGATKYEVIKSVSSALRALGNNCRNTACTRKSAGRNNGGYNGYW